MHTMLYHIGREEFIIDIEKLADKILNHQKEYNWYELNDDYGNMNDEENINNALEEIKKTLTSDPYVIKNDLEYSIELLEYDKGFEKNIEWKDTKDLLQQVNSYIEQQAEEDLEID